MDSSGDLMPLPDANKRSPRVYTNLQNIDLDTVSFAQVQSTGNPIAVEEMNEDEMRRLVLVNLARLVVAGEWTGLLEAGGAEGNAVKTTPWVDGLSLYWEVARASPYGSGTVQAGAMGTDLIMWPFISGNSGDVSLMAVAINSSVTNTMSLCIYSDLDGLPNELLGYGDFDLSGSGTIEQDTFSDTITLVKGTQYWYGPKSSSANQPNMKAINADYTPSLGPIAQGVLGITSQPLAVNTEVAYGDSIPATLTPANFTYGASYNRMIMGLEF